MKTYTVYSTVGQQQHVVDTYGTTWGEIQAELRAAGVRIDGMQVVTGESQVTLDSSQAIIPATESTLFLLPQKVKSGYFAGSEDDEDDCGCDDDDDTPVGRVKAKVREIGENVNELYSMLEALEKTSPTDPTVQKLKNKASELQKNLGLWD